MGKVFVAKIEFEYEVDKNNYLEWEDEYEEYESDDIEPRTLSNLLSLLKSEFANTLLQIEIRNCISVEEKGN